MKASRRYGRRNRLSGLNHKNKFRVGHRAAKRPKVSNAEETVESAFAELKNENFIDEYVRAKHNDSLDASHIDFAAINFSQNKLFVLQVKTKVKKKNAKSDYETAAERHKRKYPNIPLIEVKLKQDKLAAIQRTKIKLKKIYKKTPSAEAVLDISVREIIASKFVPLGYDKEMLFFY